MTDSIKIGTQRSGYFDTLHKLLSARRRQFANEGGAAVDPADFQGAPGTPAYPVIFQYSVNGSTAWHTPWATGDNFVRSSSDNGATWSAAALFVGPTGSTGAQGSTGAAGTDGNYIAVAYKTGPVAGISAPTGNGPIPSGWSGVPYAPTGTDVLWVSRATCQYSNALIGVWSTPTQFIIVADYVKANIEMATPLITGGTIRTAATGARLELAPFAVGNVFLTLYPENTVAEPAYMSAVYATGAGNPPTLRIRPPQLAGQALAGLTLEGADAYGGSHLSAIGDLIDLTGKVQIGYGAIIKWSGTSLDVGRNTTDDGWVTTKVNILDVVTKVSLYDAAEYVALYYDHASNTLKLNHGGVITTITAT